ncbi:30S ribosomal protein S16, partial [Rhabdothermincola sp.]|uniref:30S ribosomal protein S16 n=1 Tax=Rhabdothermincola sp. TaxID=2820405 RepID=UPI003FA747B4
PYRVAAAGPDPDRRRSAGPREKRENNVVKLRLMRMGKKKQPTYRIVAADSRSPRDGRFIEIVGHYDPRRGEGGQATVVVDNDKAVAWLRKGAQPTETVEKLLKVSGAWAQFKGEAPAATDTAAAS